MNAPRVITLLGRPASINVRKVLWTCTELGLAVDLQPWGSGDQSLQAPEFLALNPNAMVPVLLEGNSVLLESNTICRYLAACEGRADLLPTTPRKRAAVEQWMDWQATELNNAWRYAFLSLVRHSAAHQDAAALATSVAQWNRHMAILDGQLAHTGAYVTGAGFTLADVVLGLSAWRWSMTPMQRPDLPAVAAWQARLAGREGYRLHGANGAP